MLDNNTNKVVWVGVAVGVVAVIGAGALTLFPDAFSGMKTTISSVMTAKANAVVPTMMLSTVDKSSITPSSADEYAAFNAKSKFEWVGNSIHIVTPSSATRQYAQYNTELKPVPAGAKRLKVTLDIDQTGPNYAHPWIRYYDSNKNQLLDTTYNYYMPAEQKSKMFTVKPQAKYYRVDFESREGMDVYYKDFTMTFYND